LPNKKASRLGRLFAFDLSLFLLFSAYASTFPGSPAGMVKMKAKKKKELKLRA